MTKIGELATRSRAAGVRLQELDDALLALVPVEAREKVRLAMRMKAQFTEFQHAVADAVEWCERRERESGDDLWTIIERAASEFGVSAKAIERGWIEHNQQALNDLLQLRAAARQLNESV